MYRQFNIVPVEVTTEYTRPFWMITNAEGYPIGQPIDDFTFAVKLVDWLTREARNVEEGGYDEWNQSHKRSLDY